MRVTQSTLARIGLQQLNAQRNRLANTQEQAATGLRLNRPSDDPVDYRNTLYLKDSLNETNGFLRAIDLSRSRLRTTESAISDSFDVLSAARTTALAAQNDPTSSGSAARTALRVEIEQLFDQLVSYANAQAPGGGYVFSGLDSDIQAFTQTGTFVSGSGTPPTVAFTGDDSRVSVEIDKGVSIDVTRSGADAFQGAVDVFAVLGQLWQGIDSDQDALISTAMGDLDQAMDQLLFEQSQIGGDERKAEDFEERLRLQEQESISQISFLEDADAYEVYSSLAAQEAALQASLQVTTRLLSPTLLDFI